MTRQREAPSVAPRPPEGAAAFVHRVRTRFAETDAMGVVHHAAYLPYLEAARVEYLRSRGHPYAAVRSEGIDLVVLECAVRYRRPLYFDENVDVALGLGEVGRARFELHYRLEVGGELRATAATVHGAVDRQGRATRLPLWLVGVFGEH
ncbi:MAG: thioesterase family protein [Actinomycetota bacterium]|nr:thioesterase family protein [Actinomycetota bacterium]